LKFQEREISRLNNKIRELENIIEKKGYRPKPPKKIKPIVKTKEDLVNDLKAKLRREYGRSNQETNDI
jgi:hypothetical protein